jgi:hypothetical protein
MAHTANSASIEVAMSDTYKEQATELIDAWNNATTDTNKAEIKN